MADRVESDKEARDARFRGGLVLKAHRLLYHSTLGSRVIKKKKNILHFGVWRTVLRATRKPVTPGESALSNPARLGSTCAGRRVK